MSSLLETQRRFAHCLLTARDPAVDLEVAPWIVGDAITPAERMAIYRNTFQGVVVNALRLTYPVIERLVGADFFEGAARLFLAENPPRSACLNYYGGGFDAFLARLPEAGHLPYLPDTARLEWAVARSAVAEDAETLEPAALLQFPPESLGAIRLVPAPSLHMVDLVFPVDAIWQAIMRDDDEALRHIRIPCEPFTLLLHRGRDGIVFRPLNGAAREMTTALCAGATLGDAMAVAPEDEAMALLAEHLAAGRFTRVERTAAIQ